MALYIPYKCPKCFESVTLIQPQHKGGGFKGPARGHSPKADIRLTASIGRNRPKADLEAETVRLGEGTAITNILETRRKAIEIQDHEGRISALEAKNK